MQLAVKRHPLADDPFRACRLVHRYFLPRRLRRAAVLQWIVVPDRPTFYRSDCRTLPSRQPRTRTTSLATQQVFRRPPPDLCRPLNGPPPRSLLDIVAHQPLAAHNIGSASSRSHFSGRRYLPARTICRHAPTLSCSTVRIRIASNGGHHGLARHHRGPQAGRRGRAAERGAPAAPLPPRTLERQAARHRLDLPLGDHRAAAVRTPRRPRQPHVDHEARQAARAPPRTRLPTLGMRRRKMSPDQTLAAHDTGPLPSDSPPTERCARAIRLQHSTLLTVHTPSPPPNPHSAPPAPSDTSVVRAHAGALRGHRCLGV